MKTFKQFLKETPLAFRNTVGDTPSPTVMPARAQTMVQQSGGKSQYLQHVYSEEPDNYVPGEYVTKEAKKLLTEPDGNTEDDIPQDVAMKSC